MGERAQKRSAGASSARCFDGDGLTIVQTKGALELHTSIQPEQVLGLLQPGCIGSDDEVRVPGADQHAR